MNLCNEYVKKLMIFTLFLQRYRVL